ncbi:MAG TPA: nucleoside-diphosphate kinase [Euryarchaeota archaeon]|nr:nucleoside diphosphate kinase [archaeon BMS3Bbin15]HDL15196.1 nucleoside-diphosphate kinase [Euryarchaeota archaeon]
MERTFVMVKPDAVARSLTGEIISRIENKGLKIVALKMIKISEEVAKKHYEEHREKPFFSSMVSYMTSGPVVVLVVEGVGVVKVVRKLVGATDPKEADSGTIRGDFAIDIGRNVIHASDSTVSAEREIGLYFVRDETIEYSRADESWLYE